MQRRHFSTLFPPVLVGIQLSTGHHKHCCCEEHLQPVMMMNSRLQATSTRCRTDAAATTQPAHCVSTDGPVLGLGLEGQVPGLGLDRYRKLIEHNIMCTSLLC